MRKAPSVHRSKACCSASQTVGTEAKASRQHRGDLAVHGGGLCADTIRRFKASILDTRRNVAARADRLHESHEVGRHFFGRIVADGDHQLTKSHVFAGGEAHQNHGNQMCSRRSGATSCRYRVRELTLRKAKCTTKADGDQAGAQPMRHRLA